MMDNVSQSKAVVMWEGVQGGEGDSEDASG